MKGRKVKLQVIDHCWAVGCNWGKNMESRYSSERGVDLASREVGGQLRCLMNQESRAGQRGPLDSLNIRSSKFLLYRIIPPFRAPS